MRLTNPNKVLWPKLNWTKVDYVKYLISVAPYLLTYLRNKPVTVIRFVHGVTQASFYQKHLLAGAPDWLRVAVADRKVPSDLPHTGEVPPLEIFIENVAGLLWWANQGALEFHVGFTPAQCPGFPDALAFDLDPTVPVFPKVSKVALQIHDVLTQLQLPHIAKTSGATGLQIFIPLDGTLHFNQTRAFTKTVAEYVAKQLPNEVTLERLTRNRGDKVYIDYPQHGASRTLIAPYSPRGTREGTVSTPVTFSELAHGICPTDFTMENLPKRILELGDLFAATKRASKNDFARLSKERV